MQTETKTYKFSKPVVEVIVEILQDCALGTPGVDAMKLFENKLSAVNDSNKLFLTPNNKHQFFTLSKEVVERIGQMLAEVTIATIPIDTLLSVCTLVVDPTDSTKLVLENDYKDSCNKVFTTMLEEKTKIIQKLVKQVN